MTTKQTGPERLGTFIGSWLSTGVALYAGYQWAKHGWFRAVEIEAAFLVVIFALYGMLVFPQREKK